MAALAAALCCRPGTLRRGLAAAGQGRKPRPRSREHEVGSAHRGDGGIPRGCQRSHCRWSHRRCPRQNEADAAPRGGGGEPHPRHQLSAGWRSGVRYRDQQERYRPLSRGGERECGSSVSAAGWRCLDRAKQLWVDAAERGADWRPRRHRESPPRRQRRCQPHGRGHGQLPPHHCVLLRQDLPRAAPAAARCRRQRQISGGEDCAGVCGGGGQHRHGGSTP
mmetsp:Transcript_36311/g.72883  ORF Transcript_36311/g.72883 Transcript_36311/m.72883 type:complete len:221 (+) Transcript_36311:104-766(+)